jgi:hypothetical protein
MGLVLQVPTNVQWASIAADIVEIIQQPLCFDQIGCAETLDETVVNATESHEGLAGAALIAPQACETRRPRSALSYRMISGVDHVAVPNRHFRHFPADLRPRCSGSAAISVFAYILLTADRGFDSRSLQR